MPGDSSGKSTSSFSCWLLIGSSGYPSLVGEVLDKAGLGVSVNITALGSSVDIGSGSACLTGGGRRGSIVSVKTMSNTKSFFLEVLLESKWNWKIIKKILTEYLEILVVLTVLDVVGLWYVRIEIVEFKSSGSVPLKYLTQQELTAMTTGFSIVSYSIKGQGHFTPKSQLDDVSTVKTLSKVWIPLTA
uniref:Uncharacterized protein n=1 Tax=Tanacetum cinerariifolium TaxID=118510 RepID=A0A6L2MLB7_TANCI|nr:hypothetical protein [Tanacetum cinerariifolium]